MLMLYINHPLNAQKHAGKISAFIRIKVKKKKKIPVIMTSESRMIISTHMSTGFTK